MAYHGDALHAKNRDEWRMWLQENHQSAKEVWLTIYKRHVADPPILYEDAVEEAICFGWIDGQMRRVDDDTFVQRFTPRKPDSLWSESNIKRVEKMLKEGKMTEDGLKIYQAAMQAGQLVPSSSNFSVPRDLETALKRNREAWRNFKNLAPSAQLLYVYWVDTAKTSATRQKRIDETVKRTARNKKLDDR